MNVKVGLWILLLVGFGAGLYSAALRWQTETRNRSIEITLDYNEVRTIANAERRSVSDILRGFQQAGVTSISVQEETIGSLEESRRLFVLPGNQSREGSVIVLNAEGVGTTTLMPDSEQLTTRVTQSLQHKLGLMPTIRNAAQEEPGSPAHSAVEFKTSFTTVRGLGVGLSPETLTQIHESGLAVVGRVANFNGVRPESIVWELDQLKRQGVQTVVFAGDEMLGYRGYLVDDPKKPEEVSTAKAIRNAGLWVGVVEFGKQKGEAEISKAADDRVVRVHTVTGAEMLQANVATNVQRFTLAARERNIRLLYIRLFTDEKNPLDYNTEYIEKIVKGLKRGNLVPGIGHGYGDLAAPLWVRVLICLGIAAAWLLLVDSITRFLAGGTGAAIPVIAGLGAVLLLALSGLGNTGAKLGALAASCIFPALALLHSDLSRPASSGSPLRYPLSQFALSCVITGLGIAAIVGLLSDRLYLIKADAFIGIKVSQLIPVLLVGLVYGLNLRATPDRSTIQAIRETGKNAIAMFLNPVLVWQVVAALGALVVLALLILRSGNDPGVGVSSLELKIRAILDQLLYARPRFKEFLFGHPALVLALLYAALGNRTWAVPLLVVGAIGQASLLNTFCHLHTPLLVSLWRAGLGILIGAAFGLALYAVVGGITRRMKLAPSVSSGVAP